MADAERKRVEAREVRGLGMNAIEEVGEQFPTDRILATLAELERRLVP